MLMFHFPSFVLNTATHSVLQIFLWNTQNIKDFSLQQLPSQISLKKAATLIQTPLFLTQADLCVVSTSTAVKTTKQSWVTVTGVTKEGGVGGNQCSEAENNF